jgi:hypothetical protein
MWRLFPADYNKLGKVRIWNTAVKGQRAKYESKLSEKETSQQHKTGRLSVSENTVTYSNM